MKLVLLAALLAALLLAAAAFAPDGADACGRRRRRVRSRIIVRRPPPVPLIRRPPPRVPPRRPPVFTRPPVRRPTPPPPSPTPIVTATPTRSPTPRPTNSPTRSPTPGPTVSPTPSPTPPPPPPPITGIVPTPPTESTPYMTRSNCVKRVEFSVPMSGGETDVEEQWIYTCDYKVYVTIDLSTINEPTPCACGLAVSAPPSSNGVVTADYFTDVPNATIVIYDERRNEVIRELSEFKFQPNEETSKLLSMGVKDGNFMGAVLGFSGVVDAFPNKPSELDNTIRGNENNVAALCFTVVQRFRSKYQWPEPPLPTLYTPPAVYKSDCIPYIKEAVYSYKRQEPAATSALKTDLWFREFLVFAKDEQTTGGFNARSRYITSYYVNSACTVTGGYVSFDRHFISQLGRPQEAFGTFAWTRSYTDVYVVGGAPSAIELRSEFLASGYYRITWRQPYSVDEAGNFRPGVLAANLLGQRHADDPNSGNAGFKLCDSVPQRWHKCAAGTAGCAAKAPSQLDNHPDTYVWPTASPELATEDASLHRELSALRCSPAFTRCAGERTWLGFQNYGLAARDFTKTPTAHLLTGPRQYFCGSTDEVLFDTLKFKPHQVGKAIRKRDAWAERAAHVSAAAAANGDYDFEGARKRGVTVLENMRDPIAEALPTAHDTTLVPAVGSSGPDGTNRNNAGDHPVALFPEQYTVPLSVREEDVTCGAGYGRGQVDVDGCEAKVLSGAPPCLLGQLGCTCRTVAGRPPCDAPLECSPSKFCVKPSCAPGAPGCPCAAGNQCAAGAQCGPDGRCYAADSCAHGAPGCMCKADGTCGAGAMCFGGAAGACAVDGTCTAGDKGCRCNDAGGCNDAANFECQPELGMCVTKAFCERGAGGCECAKGSRCASGFECVAAVQKCAQPQCPPGSRGCPCAAGNSCTESNYKCVALTLDGSKTACLAEVKCEDQSRRCQNYCGVDNVLRCPACEHEVPECISAVQTGAASALGAGSLLALAVALLAALLA